MKLKVKKPFSWAHRGVDVKQYEVGQEIETDDQDLIDVSTKEGWASVKRNTRGAKVESKQDATESENAAS